MAGLSNKISNIIGTKIPTYIYNQLLVRSAKNSLQTRDTDNVRYLANKSAWIRLVSSVNIAKEDIAYFNRLGANISNQDDLAKNYVLFAGTSKYKGANNRNVPSYDIRSGIKNDGAYNLLNDKEINDYGYRPMPGITSVNVETQGALGSVRSATINFKVWDKDQLDIMDALYFKLGFTMFLEWGNTFFYKGVDSITSKQVDNTLHSTEDYSIDPFSAGLTKEDLNYKIGQNIIDTEGNYDAILGVVSNFNFSFNQEGGYDCTLKLMALGYLGDSIKINHSAILPNILEQEIKQVETILSTIEAQKAKEAKDKLDKSIAEKLAADLQGRVSIFAYLNDQVNPNSSGRLSNPTRDANYFPTQDERQRIVDAARILNSNTPQEQQNIVGASNILDVYKQENNAKFDPTTADNFKNSDYFLYDTLYLPKFGVKISKSDIANENIKSISLDKTLLLDKLNAAFGSGLGNPNNTPKLTGYIDRNILDLYEYLYSIASDLSSNNKKLFRIPDYSGNNKDSYGIAISIDLPEDVDYIDKKSRFISVLKDILDNQNLNFTNVSFATNKILKDPAKYFLTLSGESFFDTSTKKSVKTQTQNGIVYTDKVETDLVKAKAKFTITITDSALISNIEESPKLTNPFKEYITRLSAQDQIKQTSAFEEEHEGDVTSLQNKIGTFYNSSLEIILRTIQIHCFGKAIQKNGLDISKEVFPVPLAEDDIKKQIFSDGIFANPILDQLISNNIDDNAYINTPSNPEARLKVFCKYGFNTDLLANKIKVQDLKDKQVDYAGLLMCYVVPYEINNQLEVGISLTHPVYMQFGLLLMILNHMCTIYDRKKGPSNEQTPLVYIDFNPNTNFCLSNNKHLSTDPFSFLIPIQGNISENYPELFDSSILTKDKQNIIALDEKDQKIPQTKLFSTEDNILSKHIPPFKVDSENAYRGSTMNILLSIEYILNLVKQYSAKDEKGSVYLKPFLEQIISDMNKSLGNINLFRLAYNDAANTYHIIDDQFVPGTSKDDYIPKDGTTDLPLYGLNSIAKTLEIKTEISTKLANMVAISSNADSKYANSTNATDLGLINTGYTDRYINNKTEISNEKEKEKSNSNAAIINSAIKFDKTIKEFYGSISPSTDTVSFATNYYINKMSKVKSEETGSRASALIPVSINFTTDGISGMNIGQGFTIPDKFLPYTYNERNVVNGALRKVGFVILGSQQSFEANQWNTSIRANMIFLKDKDDLNSSVANQYSSVNQFKNNTSNNVSISGIGNYTNFINPVSNPIFTGVNSAKDLNTGGPLEGSLVKLSQDIFNDIKKNAKNIVINVTAGNDKFHQGLSENSKHKLGKALDFTIYPNTEENKSIVNNILKEYKNKDKNIFALDEYTNPSANSTGGHFHIQYNS